MHDYVRLSSPTRWKIILAEVGLDVEILDSDVVGLFQETMKSTKVFFFQK